MTTASSGVPVDQHQTKPLSANYRFLTVWGGHAVSVAGDGFHTVALGLWILQTTGSAAAMSAVFAARTAAIVLFSAIAGTYSDRNDRRRLMIGMDLVRAGLIGLMIALMVAGLLTIPLAIGLSFAISLAGAFFGPAFNASLVNLVRMDDVPRATSLLQLTDTIAQVTGPALGGVVVGLAGAHTALSVDALSFVVSALAVTMVPFPSPRQEGAESRGFLADMQDGLQELRRHPVVVGVMLLGPAFSLFGAAHALLMPVIAVREWGVSGFEFGLLEVTWPIGMGLAAAALAVLATRIPRRGLIMVSAFVLSGLFDIAAPLMPGIYSAVVALSLGALMTGIGLISISVLMRTLVPPEAQGRVFGLYGSLANAAYPVGTMVAGLLGDQVAPVPIAVACGVGFVLTALVGFANRRLRAFA